MRFLIGLVGKLRSLFRRNKGIKENLECLLEEHNDRVYPLNNDEHRLISNVLHAGNKTVKDLMTPRADIKAISIAVDFKLATDIMIKFPHSRYPIYKDTLDNVIGIVHIKDVLSALSQSDNNIKLMDLLRPALIIVPSMRMLDILLEMRIKGHSMSIVIDEFGGVDGLLTIEDVIEEIVGDIKDEYDIEEPSYFDIDDKGNVIIDGRCSLDLLKEKLGDFLSKEEEDSDIETIGGFIVHILGYVPHIGEVVLHARSNIEFNVLDSDPRRVNKLSISSDFLKK